MRLLFLGDIVGRPGRTVVCDALPGLIKRYGLDFVVINGENSAGGFGITETILNDLIDAGADCVTLGNHSFDQKEALVFIERTERLIRPLNYPKGTPGRGATLLKAKSGADVLVVNAMGRVFMIGGSRKTCRTGARGPHLLASHCRPSVSPFMKTMPCASRRTGSLSGSRVLAINGRFTRSTMNTTSSCTAEKSLIAAWTIFRGRCG